MGDLVDDLLSLLAGNFIELAISHLKVNFLRFEKLGDFFLFLLRGFKALLQLLDLIVFRDKQ